MATKSSSLKEKSTSPSSTPAPSTVRRSPRPSGSADHRLSTRTTISDKPAHLKPKPVPSSSTTKFTKSSPSTTATHSPPPTAGKRQPVARKPIEKPPSPSRKPIERTLSTPTTTGDRSLKPASTSPLPRPYLSSNTSHLPPDKGPKPARGPKTGSFTGSKSLDKRKAVVVCNAFVDTSSTSVSEASVIKKAELEAHVDESSMAEEDEVHKHERDQVESPGVTSDIAQDEATDSANDIVPEHVEEIQSQTLVTENEYETVVSQKEEEPKPAEIKEETMPVDESPKEAAAEPALQEAVAAKPAGPRVAAAGGTKKMEQRNNDVIEEAKSKFLEKRRNKVLALVGAFETVMALQEPEAGQQSQQPKKGKQTEEASSPASEVKESAPEPKESTEPAEPTGSTDPTEPTEPTESTV